MIRRLLLPVLVLASAAIASGRAQEATVLDELARELALETGLSVRLERAGPDAAPVLRVGPQGAPTIALVDRTLVSMALTSPDEDPRAARALELARTVLGLDRRGEPDELWASGERALAVLLGPGLKHDEGRLPRFGLNFPLGWAEARAAHGAAAGIFPAERPDVAATVDWLLAPDQDACIAVLEVSAGSSANQGADQGPHGSLQAFVERGLERGFARVGAPADVPAAALRLAAEARTLQLGTVAVERVGAQSWLCDVSVRFSPAPPGVARARGALCRVDVALEGAAVGTWIGCALEDPANGTFRVIPHAKGAREVRFDPGPGAGRGQRLRIIVQGELGDGAAAAALKVVISAPGVVTARHAVPLVALPEAQGSMPGTPSPPAEATR